MKSTREELQVIGDYDEAAKNRKGQEPYIYGDAPNDAQCYGPADGGRRHDYQYPIRYVCPQGPPLQLVQGMDTDSHGKKEGQECTAQTFKVKRWADGGSQDQIAQVPGGIRGM